MSKYSFENCQVFLNPISCRICNNNAKHVCERYFIWKDGLRIRGHMHSEE